MTEWKEWNGSDEQIAEMRETINGFILRDSTGVQTEMFKRIGSSYIGEYIDSRRRLLSGNNLKEVLTKHKITNYLICNPHPLADMICRQARTGQPVWMLMTERQYWIMPLGEFEGKAHINGKVMIKTTKPNWHLNAEYSFTEFKEELNYERDREKSN